MTAQQRWLYKLMGYNFQVEYKRGGQNIVAYALSCRHEVEYSEGSLFALTQLLPHWLNSRRK